MSAHTASFIAPTYAEDLPVGCLIKRDGEIRRVTAVKRGRLNAQGWRPVSVSSESVEKTTDSDVRRYRCSVDVLEVVI